MALVIAHVQDSHRSGADHAARERGFADHDQHVERVPVIGQRSLDEPVIAWVVDTAVQDAVEDEPMPDVVELVLVQLPDGISTMTSIGARSAFGMRGVCPLRSTT